MAAWKCNQKLWKSKDGKIVPDGDPRAAFLFATPGMVLEEEPKIEGKKPGKDSDKKLDKKSEGKAIDQSEDKAIDQSEDK